MKPLLLIIGLPLAYAATGIVCFMIVPPGYASTVFIPAGLAATAAFFAGALALPGVFLGSFLLNLAIGYSIAGMLEAKQTSIALIIASASTMQAVVAGAALRLLRFDRPSIVFVFFLVAPIVCVTSATLSLGGLCAAGFLPWNAFAPNWLMWWTGDTLGVIISLPLLLWRPS